MDQIALYIGIVGGLIGIVGSLIGIAGTIFAAVVGGAGLLVTLLGWDGVLPTVRRWLARRRETATATRREHLLAHVRSVLGSVGPGGPAGLALRDFSVEDRPLIVSLCDDGMLVLQEGTVFIPERAPRPFLLAG